jgi:hypothetical protein
MIFFLLSTWIAGNFFSKSSNPPPPQKSNGPPLRTLPSNHSKQHLELHYLIATSQLQREFRAMANPNLRTGMLFGGGGNEDMLLGGAAQRRQQLAPDNAAQAQAIPVPPVAQGRPPYHALAREMRKNLMCCSREICLW